MKRGEEQDDYLMRQVRAVAAVIARLVGLRDAGSPMEAIAEAEHAIRKITGVDPAHVPRIAATTLREWITDGARSGDPAELLRASAALFREHAATLERAGRAGEAAAYRARAAALGEPPGVPPGETS